MNPKSLLLAGLITAAIVCAVAAVNWAIG